VGALALDGLVGTYQADDHERADACVRAKRLAHCLGRDEALMRFMARAAQVGDTLLVVALGLILAGEEPTPERVSYLLRE
jgi:hypothetical protein